VEALISAETLKVWDITIVGSFYLRLVLGKEN
jgi:hypothetical protein